MTEAEKLRHCVGCTDNFYNGQNPMGVKRCWSLPKAKLVTKFQTGTWTRPDEPGAFTEMKVLNCFHAKGLHYYERVPSFVRPEEINRLPEGQR